MSEDVMENEVSGIKSAGESALDPSVLRQTRLRRSSNKLRSIHHHAFRCRDAEETRHFYEDILQMPLVAAMVMDVNLATADKEPFCHIFFEMGDGNCIAFFDYPAVLKDRTFKPDGPFDHHLAIEVEGDEVLEEYRSRLQAANIPSQLLDHGVFHSLYFNDPNGLNCELVSKVRATHDNDVMEAQSAHENLKKWTVRKKSPS
jgi:glyoxylase I family protein